MTVLLICLLGIVIFLSAIIRVEYRPNLDYIWTDTEFSLLLYYNVRSKVNRQRLNRDHLTLIRLQI